MLSFEAIQQTVPKQSKAFTPGFVKVQEYLKARGVDVPLITKCGLEIVFAKDLFQGVYNMQSFDDRMAIVFKHQSVTGHIIPWWSARLVEVNPPRPSFAQRGKMFCPPNQAPHAYLDPLTDWSAIVGKTVYIHESCVKAINSARLGFPSVGLNGVFGFTSRKHKVDLVEELRDLPWKGANLKCKIVFDSNAADNPNIKYAISQLSERMFRLLGVEATHLLLPKSPTDEHWGFDDYAVFHGADKAKAFLEQDGAPVDIGDIERLKTQLNSEVCVVTSLGRIAMQENGALMNRNSFVDVNYAHYVAKVEKDDTIKIVNVPKLWLSDERRTTVTRIDYMPGKPRIHDDALNLWKGMGCNPAAGEVQPFFELLVNNIGDHDIVRWALQWMAYPLQNMGAKLNTYLHLFGPSGTGKNMLLRPLQRVYGGNFISMSKENIESNFNSIYAGKQLVHIDEMHGGDRQSAIRVQQKLKLLVTSTSIVVNQKGQPEYEIRNFANIVTTSNYYDSIRLDEDDRRACVIKFENIDDKRGDQEYWLDFVTWCDNGGAEALYHYLLEYDMDGFDPMGWAPRTKWKDQVTDASRSPIERWVHELRDDPETAIPMNMANKALFTSKELATLYFNTVPDDIKKGQIDAVSSCLRNAGFAMANDGKYVKFNDTTLKYWVIKRRDETWDHADCLHHLKALQS
jgi:hypothetical protein